MSGKSSKNSGFFATLGKGALKQITGKNKSSTTSSSKPVASESSSATPDPSTASASGSTTSPATTFPVPESFGKSIQKGKSLCNLMAQASSADVDHSAAFAQRYSITVERNTSPPYPKSQSTSLGLPDNAYADYEALKVLLTTATPQITLYKLSRNTAHGILSADGGDRQGKDDRGLPWSESAYQVFTHQVTPPPVPAPAPAHLRYLFQRNIVNTETETLLGYFVGEGKDPVGFVAPSDGFYALLGCENGRGAAYLVKDHGLALGVTTVRKVTAFKKLGGWNMVIEFG